MKDAAAYSLVLLFVVSWAVALVGLAFAVICMFRLPFNIKSESLDDGTSLNPLNVMFSPEKLSETGVAVRRLMWWGFKVFFGSVLIGFAVALAVFLIERP